MKEIKITNLKKEEKLLYYIREIFPNLSVSVLHKALRNKDIKVNGKRITDSNYILKNNDILNIYIDDTILYGFPKELQIQYEDDNILVAFKPQGILSNNEEKFQSEPTFEDFVKRLKGDNLRICHRLDRNTSGLIIFSKNDISYSCLLDAFKNNYITKEYTAYVFGTNFDKEFYHCENYLLKDEKTGFSKIYNSNVNGSQKIITDFWVERKYIEKNYSILKVQIHTGKTHQIRALLSSMSYPIIGDSKYGKNDINKKYKKYKQMLFATKYSFNFPKNTYLAYLNKINICLDENFYMEKI
jgi:23S rRNA pseudouridine955/2504/2580 synthase